MCGKGSERVQKWTFSPALLQNKKLPPVQNLQRGWRPEEWGKPKMCYQPSLICLPTSASLSSSQSLHLQGVGLDQRFLAVLHGILKRKDAKPV